MNPKLAVVLFQLGGPDSPEAVEPFLYNLFCDPDIISFPGAFLARKPLAKFISSRRSEKAKAHYREIGGKSPILELTMAQAKALEAELQKLCPSSVFVAMRYWHPMTEETVRRVKEGEFSQVVLIPLYPQYSRTTTLSSLREWNRQCRLHHLTDIRTSSVCCYFNHPKYIAAIVERVQQAYARFSLVHPLEIDLVFSAHGVPESVIREGDPYKYQIEETVRLVAEAGGWKSPHYLCYQSKVGPAEWIKPSLDATILGLAAKGRKNLLVIPIAFVTEHIETLHEIDIEARESARRLGITRFEMMPALNDSSRFIECLVDLVTTKSAGEALGLPTCRNLFQKDPSGRPPALCPYWLHEGR